MNHVFQCEGTLFLYAIGSDFSEQDIEELNKISDTIS